MFINRLAVAESSESTATMTKTKTKTFAASLLLYAECGQQSKGSFFLNEPLKNNIHRGGAKVSPR